MKKHCKIFLKCEEDLQINLEPHLTFLEANIINVLYTLLKSF